MELDKLNLVKQGINATSEKNIFLITIMVLSLGQITSDLYLPSLPAIAEGLNTSLNLAQFTLSIYVFGFAIAQIIYGPISDSVGRRKPLLIGLLICLLGSIVCFTAQSIQLLLIGRLIQGLGAGATLTLPSAIIRDRFEGNNLAKYSSYAALISVGFLAGAPLLGGYLQEYFGWRASFLFLLLYTIIALLTTFFIISETNVHKSSENLRAAVIKKNLLILFKSPVFIGYCSCSLLIYGALLAWLTDGTVVLQNIVGLSPVAFGWIYILTGIAFAAGALVNSKLVFRLGIQKMLIFGLICVLLSGITMLALKLLGYINTFVIIGPILLLLFGASLVFPNSSAGVFHPFPKIAGTASAVFYSTRVLAGSIFSGILALMPNHNQLPMAITFILSAVMAIAIFYLTIISCNCENK